MAMKRVRLAALAGAASWCIGSSALACPVPIPMLGSLLHGSGLGDCDPGCGPLDCGPAPLTGAGAGGNGWTFDSTGRGGAVFPVSMIDNAFVPVSPIIKPDTTVRWTNNGVQPHTSTRFGRWDSGFLNSGQTFDHDFTDADAGLAFGYICVLHFGMEGKIQVARFGDANLDGTVNLADFNVLASNFGQTGRDWETGDFNGDGVVNLADFNLLAANFGMGINPAVTTLNIDFGSNVPEPTIGSLLVPLMLMKRRRRSI